ncbi:MAG TPA: hypothetical protein VH280_06255 [Verrucomicrobiae bacterium]|nr:hypothetical protein [Verrucomicrobiae bacterium]
MKKQIAGFILGGLFGGAVISAIADENNRPTAWDYKVITENVAYNVDTLCTDALKQAATNGWEVLLGSFQSHLESLARKIAQRASGFTLSYDVQSGDSTFNLLLRHC